MTDIKAAIERLTDDASGKHKYTGENGGGWTEVRTKDLRAVLEVVKRLPRTADGVPIFTGMDLWFWTDPQLSEPTVTHGTAPGPCAPHGCYSTREAALAAKEKQSNANKV